MNVRIGYGSLCWVLTGILVALPITNRADQLELANGDRYTGKVIAITETNVTLRSEINGLMQLPRSKVTVITLGDKLAAPATAPGKTQVVPTTKPVPKDLSAQIKAQGIDPKSVKQVQEQILAGATPEATAKFNEMVSGLLLGRLSVDDIRAQARSSVKELQDAKKDLGEEFGAVLDSYLNILEGFLSESDTDAAAKQKPKAQSKNAPAREQPVEPPDDE